MEARRIIGWRWAAPLALAGLLWAGPATAAPGDMESGEQIYLKRCLQCHGEEGDGLGPAAERLNPPPRDFTLGQYKIMTTGFEDIVPNDEDLFRMVRDGMPGTAMPGWSDILAPQDIWNVIAYIKTFAGLEEEEPSEQVDYGTQVASSAESIAKGKAMFLDGDRCSECHGKAGKGDGIKRLKGDNGERTWPRNLTKPWTFRASNDPKDIFARITVGIPGTQMPSFANPKNKKKLTIEERWHVANYAASLAETTKVPRAENTVIKAAKLDGDLPSAADDPRWEQAAPSTFLLLPQIIGGKRFFTPSNDTITVRALYSDTAIAFHLEWDDRTRSIPGDPKAEEIADPGLSEDAVAIQLPVTIPSGMEKPYFAMGDAAKPVNLWRWQSGTTEQPESVSLATARGREDVTPRDAAAVGLAAKGAYRDGTWQVVMTRALTLADSADDIQFAEGVFTPIALAAWDGSNSEKGASHTLTTWYWLQLKPASGAKPVIAAVAVALLVGALLLWWGRVAAQRVEKSPS